MRDRNAIGCTLETLIVVTGFLLVAVFAGYVAAHVLHWLTS